MTFFFFLFLIIGLIYFSILLFITSGLFKIAAPNKNNRQYVSVIVAVRNEEKNIEYLLTALLEQTHPHDRFQVILVDDGSTDKTREIILAFQQANPNFSMELVQVTDRKKVKSPKKNALTKGIALAKHEILLLTDADCVPPPGWVAGISDFFTEKTDFVIGFSPYEIPSPRSIVHYFQAIDSLSLAALAAGSTGWNSPATCNGRNLAYRKSLFLQVDGFSSIDQFESGDDDLFLNVIKQNTDAKISYALAPGLIVPTKMLDSFEHFFYQRIRHASKGLHYGWKKTSIFSLLYLYNVGLFVGALIALFQNQLPWYGILLFIKWHKPTT